jgi:hypothetical protein
MSADNMTPIAVIDTLTGWRDGLTPEVQAAFDRAAALVEQAIAILGDALQVVEPDTDADGRISDGINELGEALYGLKSLAELQDAIDKAHVKDERKKGSAPSGPPQLQTH